MNGHADKRSVSTDALETLGMLISEDEKRDAIHLAVEPVTAATILYPGMNIGFDDNNRATNLSKKLIGVVDPFLKSPVYPGQRFWLVIYPREITSLRHVWTHPDFDQKNEATDSQKFSSQLWLNNYANSLQVNVKDLIEAAQIWIDSNCQEYYYGPGYGGVYGSLEGINTDIEFWKHFENVSGKKVEEKYKDNFFSCSC